MNKPYNSLFDIIFNLIWVWLTKFQFYLLSGRVTVNNHLGYKLEVCSVKKLVGDVSIVFQMLVYTLTEIAACY